MRLINVDSLQLETFFGDQIPPYAILSHRWGNDDEEVSFEDVRGGYTQKSGMQKIVGCCAQAKMDNIKYAWIDTCCINKDSSKELDEAINSMFQWYRRASVCYTYLADIPADDDAWDPASKFFSSSWFRRGWTLQELLAPGELRFYDQEWNFMGSKADLSGEIETITGIPREFLLGWVDFHKASVAQRMSWASKRETKREEDIAYCLLGIFDVTMPMIYGEGRKAFERLQLKIMEQTTDDSILAWGVQDSRSEPSTKSWLGSISAGVFASSPAAFANCGDIVPRAKDSAPANTFVVSGGYVRTSLRVLPHSPMGEYGLLNCGPRDSNDVIIGIPLLPTTMSINDEYMRPQGHPPFFYMESGTDASTKAIRIQVDPQLRASQVTGSRFWLHIDGHQKLRLNLRETWPPLRWEKGRALVANVDSDQHSRRRYLARFSANLENTCDIIVVLEFDMHGQQSSVDYYTFATSNDHDLERFGKIIDLMQQKDLERKIAENGKFAVKATMTKNEIARETIFTLILTRTTEPTASCANPHQLISTAKAKQHFLGLLWKTGLARSAEERFLEDLTAERRALRAAEAIQRAAKEHERSLEEKKRALEEEIRALAKERESDESDIRQTKDNIHRLEGLRKEATDQRERCGHLMDAWERSLNQALIADDRNNWLEEIIQKQLDRNKVTQEKQGELGPGYSKITFLAGNEQDIASSVPLLWAAANGKYEIAEQLLQKGSNVDMKDNDDNTALLLSVSKGNKAMTGLLLKHGASLETKNKTGDTPLSMTAYKGHASTTALLLEKNANIESRNNDQSTPLAIAARRGHLYVVDLLLERGADYEAVNQWGDSPLSRAATYGHEEVVRLLLDKGANSEVKNKRGFTPLQLARKNGHEALVKWL
ncbi:hypothetical protein NW762_011587 [Fusarium torreyae]|uniref:Heterokaryon incompatibility domain-containing protein n=1 Tax=Fusarium torreyae TaxID=1237075 RepID=A0A9W8RT36_9HYPO|nr:hypothetical protein NW762_011587 [Fusarium torreyae]